MIQFVITAGGTSEPIDGVRKITNTATGSLGWHCLEAIFSYFENKTTSKFHIHYIHAENAVIKPLSEEKNNHVSFIPISDAASVYRAVDHVTKKEKINYFIHSMAISDFTFSYAVDPNMLTQELTETAQDEIYRVLQQPERRFPEGQKITSGNDLIIALKRTKKVIPLIKQNNPDTILVGFKLLKNATEEELIDVATQLEIKNGCDFVLANDLSEVSEANHQALLIRKGEVISRLSTKKEIAWDIIDKITSL